MKKQSSGPFPTPSSRYKDNRNKWNVCLRIICCLACMGTLPELWEHHFAAVAAVQASVHWARGDCAFTAHYLICLQRILLNVTRRRKTTKYHNIFTNCETKAFQWAFGNDYLFFFKSYSLTAHTNTYTQRGFVVQTSWWAMQRTLINQWHYPRQTWNKWEVDFKCEPAIATVACQGLTRQQHVHPTAGRRVKRPQADNHDRVTCASNVICFPGTKQQQQWRMLL